VNSKLKGDYTMGAKCETCSMRLKAEKKPDSIMAKIWRWHTKWCPGWKAYQRELNRK